MISRRLAWFFPPAVLLLLPFLVVQACGPDFMPDVFVRATHPDNPQSFAQGHLGILQPRFDSSDFAVAFRYLGGGALSKEEKAAYIPKSQPPVDWSKMTPDQVAAAREAEAKTQPSLQWKLAQAKYTGGSDPATQQKIIQVNLGFDATYYNPNYPNCPDAAFTTAVLTLNSRAATWGAQSPYLKNWLQAQSAVLSNCSGKNPAIPAAAPSDSPALLRADRAYQIAAATFYAGKFEDAQHQFEAIANDKSSPWHIWGDYLAARAEVRLAFSQTKPTDPWSGEAATFNMQTMQNAQQKLEALLQHHDPALPRRAILDELNFVRIRTEPEKRLAEICAALTGPASDPDFRQNLDDLRYFLYRKVSVTDPPPLYAWIAAIRQGGGNAAYATWQQNHSQPWLVAAMMNAAPQDTSVPALLDAAAAVQPSSSAYDIVSFHRARLLIALNRADEARTLLDNILSQLNQPKDTSIRNAFLGERMQIARNFEELLTYAPRSVLEKQSEGAYALDGCVNSQEKSGRQDCTREDQPFAFDEDSVAILNRQIPLSMLVEAASSTTLPSNLRQNVVLASWVRAVLLHDDAAAAKLAPQLPETINKTAGSSIGFPAVLAILRNPGLRPNLESGISRLSSYTYLESYRDNWWCGIGQRQYYGEPQKPSTPKPLTFLSNEEQKEAESQYQQLTAMPCAPALLGQRVIDYAKTHSSDPDVPEALALTVRATRFGWLDSTNIQEAGAQNSNVSKTAFQLLHTRYPKSPWTAKTPYHY